MHSHRHSYPQIVKESFVEDVNNLLNAGEVPNMMAEEDMAYILSEVSACIGLSSG